MGEKYEPVRANLYLGTEGEVRVTEETQLDRVEKKVDRILELLEGQELSTHAKIDGEKMANTIYSAVTDR